MSRWYRTYLSHKLYFFIIDNMEAGTKVGKEIGSGGCGRAV